MRRCKEVCTKLSSWILCVSFVFVSGFVDADVMKLLLSDPPKFKPPPSSKAVGVEGENLIVPLVAEGNPISIQYTWTKDGLPITSRNGV